MRHDVVCLPSPTPYPPFRNPWTLLRLDRSIFSLEIHPLHAELWQTFPKDGWRPDAWRWRPKPNHVTWGGQGGRKGPHLCVPARRCQRCLPWGRSHTSTGASTWSSRHCGEGDRQGEGPRPPAKRKAHGKRTDPASLGRGCVPRNRPHPPLEALCVLGTRFSCRALGKEVSKSEVGPLGACLL